MNKIKNKLLLLLFVPLVMVGAVSIAISTSQFISYSNSEANIELLNAAETVNCVLNELYPGEYSVTADNVLQKGKYTINGRIELFDVLKSNTALDYSLFKNNKRVSTTIQRGGNYLLGSSMNEQIWKELKNTGDYVTDIVSIDEETYFACYIPIKESNGSVIGALGVAKIRSDVKKRQQNILLPIIAVISVLLILALLMVLSYGKELADCIGEIKEFVGQIANERFTTRLSDKTYERTDELGEIGRDITVMRNTLRDMIELDGLTQLYNKRTGNKKFEGLRNKCEYAGKPYCLGMGDIDFFKKVNDTYGHEAGDEVLKTIASIIKKHMKGNGFVARWGGEEFLIGFDNKNIQKAHKILTETLNEVRSTIVPYGDQDIHVTMTFGIVSGKPEISTEELFVKADNRLYEGKENGRNQIVVKG